MKWLKTSAWAVMNGLVFASNVIWIFARSLIAAYIIALATGNPKLSTACGIIIAIGSIWQEVRYQAIH